MRLINAKTLQLEEFLGENIPLYAILSHTWGPEEVSFNDFQAATVDLNGSLLLRKTAGGRKILHACKRAVKQGWEFIWVDTCCIDKSSSAELTEAINSMFQWYANSEVCLVHLEDFSCQSYWHKDARIEHCRWFTRGWCLQELLAPRKLLFFDSAWTFVAEKGQIIESLARSTKISLEVLTGRTALEEVSIACRLSWAATRQTTRVEDQAYCLLGILGINMPLLYGEGSRAFQRLQQEILKTHDDPSIFAWHNKTSTEPYQEMLAPTLSCFADCGNIQRKETTESLQRTFSHTSRGIRVTFPNLYFQGHQNGEGGGIYLLVIHDICATSDEKGYIVISLTKVQPGGYMRLNKPCAELSLHFLADPLGSDDDIHIVRATNSRGLSLPGIPIHTEFIRVECSGHLAPLRLFPHQEVEPRASWDSAHSRFFFGYHHAPWCYIKLYPQIKPDKPRSVWFVLALRVVRDISRKERDSAIFYLVPSKVWEPLEGLKSTKYLVANAIKHRSSVMVSGSPPSWKHRLGSLTILVTYDRELIHLNC